MIEGFRTLWSSLEGMTYCEIEKMNADSYDAIWNTLKGFSEYFERNNSLAEAEDMLHLVNDLLTEIGVAKAERLAYKEVEPPEPDEDDSLLGEWYDRMYGMSATDRYYLLGEAPWETKPVGVVEVDEVELPF